MISLEIYLQRAASEDGLKNSSEMLQMTVTQLQQYRQLARKALALATIGRAAKTGLLWSNHENCSSPNRF